MFGGIVETIGTIQQFHTTQTCRHFTIMPQHVFDDLRIGDSIAVNGVCLTVTQFTANTFDVTAVPETLRLTNLGHLTVNSTVNLERSLKLTDRIGGHYVQGHVDGTGEIIKLEKDGDNTLLVTIAISEKLSRYLVKKGYITIDGMSITVIDVAPTWFTVTFIPHTQAVTVVSHYCPGRTVNIEVDILGKYVEKLVGGLHANVTVD